MQVGLDIVTSANCKSKLQFQQTNIYQLLYITSSTIFNQQGLWADGILIPNLHKALPRYMPSMKTLITLFIFSFCTFSESYSQTQGDQEILWVKKIYSKEYFRKAYPIFTGSIRKESNFAYRFNDRIIMTYEHSQDLEYILLNGLFYPQLITGDSTIKFDHENENNISRIFRNDTLTLGNFEEVDFQAKNFKVKRFSFYVSKKGIMNPSLYTLEILNDKAVKGMPSLAFYKGAKVTFWKHVSVLL